MSRYIVGATWADAPHLTEEAKAELEASILPYQRDARMKGIPQLGAGAVYPIGTSDVVVPDLKVPDHWARGYAMDVGGGAKPTAAVFGALDRDTATLYITSVYKYASNEPAIHAAAIKARMGGWTWPGVGDAAALILTEYDAEQLVNTYRRLGLDLHLADKSVETGILETWDALTTGRLKVFASCAPWFQEFRLYQRDKRGRIKKVNDHLMDCTRYLVRSGIARMKVRPAPKKDPHLVLHVDEGAIGLGWMQG